MVDLARAPAEQLLACIPRGLSFATTLALTIDDVTELDDEVNRCLIPNGHSLPKRVKRSAVAALLRTREVPSVRDIAILNVGDHPEPNRRTFQASGHVFFSLEISHAPIAASVAARGGPPLFAFDTFRIDIGADSGWAVREISPQRGAEHHRFGEANTARLSWTERGLRCGSVHHQM
jgi:hypothetical protein